MSELEHVVIDGSGAELWREPYILRRLYAAGQTFVQEFVEYHVVSCVRIGNKVVTRVTPSTR